ncbi:MAG: response regulator transcription factor [Minisyncoccia bacterium]
MKILVVEDEQRLAEGLAEGLARKGYAADIVNDGERAYTRISLHRTDYDLVLLDLSLPTMSGAEVARQMREHEITLPILVLTADSSTDHKVELLLAGADDYLVKPFSFDELHARIQAILRRPKEALPAVIEISDLTLDPAAREAKRDGEPLSLTLKEFGLLEYFMRHPNQVVNREDLIAHLWDFNYDSFSNVVDVHVKNLRRKLDDSGAPSVLETVRGIGYRLRA